MKRTKTFTGCWTCRARKVKCDEAKPSCNRCLHRDYECEGYGVRLQWLPGQVGPNANTAVSPDSTRGGVQRRQWLADTNAQTLDGSHIRTILEAIDSVECDRTEGSSPSGRQPSGLTIGNFGVFGPMRSPHWDGPRSEGISLLDGQVDNDNVDESILDHGDGIVNGLGIPDEPGYVLHSTLRRPASNHGALTPAASDGNSSPDDPSSKSAPASLAMASPRELWAESHPSPSPSLQSFSLPLQERYLMQYYIEKVVQLSCVIDNAKSPWKTIHLPRALQSIGQLSIQGHTSRIRHALRNDLLSISAFQLSNDHKFHQRKDEASMWNSAASQYRCNAIGLLKQAVESDLYSNSRPKYKDFLATMLSMISINVMSGDTGSCSVHLDGAGQLISHMRGLKTNYSPKAKALHRIYYYVRLIYESTAVSNPSFCARYPMPVEGDESSIRNSLNITERDDIIIPCIETDKTRLSTYEYVYGIPRELLTLLRRCIEIMDLVNDFRTKNETIHLSEALSHRCEEVERDILDWSCDKHLKNLNLLDGVISSQIILHQTRAFYNAIVIFFCQNVRLLNHRYLRQYIEGVIDSIEEIEKIKADTHILAAPLYWPAFIGASESFESRFQERFRRWYGRVEMYGIEAVRTGIRVLDEVWRVGPDPNRTTSSWRMVIQKTGAVLMLT